MRYHALAALALVACTGQYPGRGAKPPGGGDGASPGIEAAALPYAIVDGQSGKSIAADDFWGALTAARVVCLGEDHDDPHHHWAQLEIVDQLSQRRGRPGLALGLEMVQRPFQGVLDDYVAARIDEATMLSRTGWAERWVYDYDYYRPTIQLAVARGADVVALNAAREITKKVVRQGLDALTSEERGQIAAELDLEDVEHRAWFDGVMSAMGGAEAHPHSQSSHPPVEAAPEDAHHGEPVSPMPSADRVYTVQVIWDETMAEGAARWAGQADRAMVVLAGAGHCHGSAMQRRIARRGVTPVVTVRPIIDDGEGNVAAAIQERQVDYLFVMSLPSS